ncbi:hypothetical protein [Mesorhizobium sp. B4-1-4]|uniref:hypothetical protein n=1 Tax=Mesorhizobium sp. B4-1-4 TaxID=2589888 RepID=UPI00112B409A|nr:hypothetical protein [Mesorhizobium sp. B4-1-4]UCI29455.1 hypothetical protein FJW03_16485 [Mesorhizobium sp. B4-1-4]
MSANPEAFEFLRQAAYGFVRKNGKDRWKLLDFCTSSILEWLKDEGSELSESEALRVAADVTRWTIEKYNPPRKKAERSREERAATEVSAPLLLEFAAETYGAATVRHAARFSGQSKSTVARHLRQHGISPVRQKKIETLPLKERRLVAILDETFPRDGSGLVLIDELAAVLWDNCVRTATNPLPEIARSTKSTRRKRLGEYLTAINRHGLGLHFFVKGDVVAVRRGREFNGMKDTLIWIDDERRLRGTREVRLPKVTDEAHSYFWDDPWLSRVLIVLEMGLWGQFVAAQNLEPFLELTHPLIDRRPLYPWFQRAIDSYSSDGFAENLAALSDKIIDPEVRRAARFVAGKVMRLQAWARYGHPADYFDDADRELGFMTRLREVAPESFAHCAYLRDVIFMEFMELDHETSQVNWEALKHCKRLRELECSGEWTPPTARELAYYHPVNAERAYYHPANGELIIPTTRRRFE